MSLNCYNRKCVKSLRKIKKVAEHISLSWHNKKTVKKLQQSWKGSGIYELALLLQKMWENQKGSGIYDLAFSLPDKTGIAWKSFSKVEKVAEWARITKP